MAEPELAVKQSGFGGRGYKHPLTGRVVPSVTTVLKAANKPAITQWAVDQTAAYAVANIDSLMSRSELQGWGFLRFFHKRNPLPLEEGTDIRNFHLGVLDDAAELGTSTHNWVEADVDMNLPFPDTTLEPDTFWQMVAVWNEFKLHHTVEPVYTELTVWNETWGYAGTLDGLWLIDGKLYLLDIKTSRNLWPEHLMQLAALRNAETMLVKQADGTWLELPFNLPIDNIGMLHIRPDDVENNGQPKPAYIELVEAEDLDLHWEAFKGLLKYKQAERAIQQRRLDEKAAAKAEAIAEQKRRSFHIIKKEEESSQQQQ